MLLVLALLCVYVVVLQILMPFWGFRAHFFSGLPVGKPGSLHGSACGVATQHAFHIRKQFSVRLQSLLLVSR